MEIVPLGEYTYLIKVQPPTSNVTTKREEKRHERIKSMNELLTLFPSLSKHELQIICSHALRYIQEE